MDYSKVYNKLIESRKKINREKSKEVYYESHHIIPKCLEGSNKKDNLVLLTPKEHFIAHLLLTKMYEGKAKQKMHYALWRLIRSSKINFSAKKYNEARILYSQSIRGFKHTDLSKKIISEKKRKFWELLNLESKKEIGEKISQSTKGRSSFNKGKKLEEIVGELKAKILKENASKNAKLNFENLSVEKKNNLKEEVSKRFKGKKFEGERLLIQKEAIKKGHKTRQKNGTTGHSKETKKKMSESRKGMQTTLNKCWIRNGEQTLLINKIDLENFQIKGWEKGRKMKKYEKRKVIAN